jgi:hypothetical protein
MLLSTAEIYHVASLLLVLGFAALTAMHLVAWTMSKRANPAQSARSSGGCGCHAKPTNQPMVPGRR